MFVLMSITTVDYVDIGDNFTLSELSRGYCQDARITFGPLREGCDRDMGMLEELLLANQADVGPGARLGSRPAGPRRSEPVSWPPSAGRRWS